ncbi:MAG: MlaD family protein [Aquabacterium sp.]|uniref:MlaD family protein n=1 Tax=Aquabacterium sp. TaxID=1872578 RepID=UPI00271AE2D1|nr:MlaD family protein [Aquabacterium sp.]MDO9005549.1 MlaD family protein [Aquabacterium sp.]
MKRNALLVGGFVVTALILIVAGLVTLGGADLFSKRQKAVVYFQGSVRGLYVGAPVSFRGVKIGEVLSIGIEVDPKSLVTRIPVGLTLAGDMVKMGGEQGGSFRKLPDLVQRGLRAKLIIQSVVTGQTSIDLDFKPNTPVVLLGGGSSAVPEIPAMRDKLDALLDQVAELPLADLVQDVRRTINQLDQTLKVTQQAVALSGKEIGAAAAQAKQTLVVGAKALQDVQAQAQATLASVEQLSESSRNVVLQTQPEIQQTLQAARDAAQAAQQAMGNFAELSAVGSPLRSDAELAVRDLSLAARSLRSFADQLERQPNSILFGKKAP